MEKDPPCTTIKTKGRTSKVLTLCVQFYTQSKLAPSNIRQIEGENSSLAVCRREKVQVTFWNIPRGTKLPHHTCGLSVNITTFSRLISDPCGRVSGGMGCKLFYFFFLNLLSSPQYVFKFELFQIRIRFFRLSSTIRRQGSTGPGWKQLILSSLACSSSHLFSRVPIYPHFPSLTSVSCLEYSWLTPTNKTQSKSWIFDIQMPPAHKIENDRIIASC